jgi:micrococcal nuclease
MPTMKSVLLLVTAAAIGVSTGTWAHAETLDGVVTHIVDGDTLDIVDADGVVHRIRPTGCNAPERGQPYAREATESLSRMTLGRGLHVDVQKAKRNFGVMRKIGLATVDG